MWKVGPWLPNAHAPNPWGILQIAGKSGVFNFSA